MIGVLVAANKEWNYVKDYYKIGDKVNKYVFGEHFLISINGNDTLFFKAGSRKSNVSASLQYMIDNFKLSKVILIGTTAGINKKYNLLDILIPTKAIQGDCSFIEKGESFQDKFIYNLNLSKYGIKDSVTICSLDKPLIYKEDSNLMRKCGIDIRDMESGAVANICEINKVELVIIKGITDFPDNYEPGEEQYFEYKNNVPKVMEKILKDYLDKFI